MLVLLSSYVISIIRLSILVCAAASLSCACLVSFHVSAPYVISWPHTGVLGLRLYIQADCEVAYEEIPVFGLCPQPVTILRWFDLFVLFIFFDAVMLIISPTSTHRGVLPHVGIDSRVLLVASNGLSMLRKGIALSVYDRNKFLLIRLPIPNRD